MLEVGNIYNLSSAYTEWNTTESYVNTNDNSDGILVSNLVFTTITSLMTLIGTIGNIFVVSAVAIYSPLQSLANVFICNLAVADLCVSAVLNPLVIAGMFTGGDVFQNNFMCHFFSSVCLISCTCSIWSIAAIGFNRYVSICHHSKYRYYFNNRTVPIMLLSLWLFGALVDLPNLIGWNQHVYDDRFLHCAWDPSASLSYKYFTFGVAFALPINILLFSYLRILIFFRAAKLELQRFTQNGQTKIKTVDIRLLRSVAVVLAVFSFLWLPYCIFAISDYKFHWSRNYYMFGVTCAHFSSCVNSVIYATTNVTFRKGYFAVMRRCYRRYREPDICTVSQEQQLHKLRASIETQFSGEMNNMTSGSYSK